MEIQEYISKKQDLYKNLLDFFEGNAEESFNKLINYLDNCKIKEQKSELFLFLRLVTKISKNHVRFPGFRIKISKILLYLKKDINNIFSNLEIFNIFKSNKLILLFLSENQILKIDQFISSYLLLKSEEKFCHYFYPEIKSMIPEEERKQIEQEIPADNFEVYRHSGENENYICTLIRNDSIEEFITYINQRNISLESEVPYSIFETNSFLIKNKNTKIIEYAVFFGSIQVFKYLCQNHVPLDSSLWLYAIHSNNSEMIYLLEENCVKPIENSYKKCYLESIKCHHNDVANYFLDNFIIDNADDKCDKYALRYYNYIYFPSICQGSDSIFYYLCEYNYSNLTELFLKKFTKCSDLQDAINNNQIDAIYKMLMDYDSIKTDMFEGYSNLVKLVIPPSIKIIEDSSFQLCYMLKKIILPNSLTYIDSNAFRYCRKLHKIKIPFSLESMGNKVFMDCTSLKKMLIPPSLNSIGFESFRSSGIKKILLPITIKKIGGNFFFNCENLEQISFPSTIENIRNSAFFDCGLKNVSLPKSLQCIRQNLFHGCKKLTEIKIPSSVKSIGSNAFHYCIALTKVEFEKNSTIHTIACCAFSRCFQLPEITIPSSLKEIGAGCFEYCSSLRFVKFEKKSKLKHIYSMAFNTCSKLEKVDLPPSVIYCAKSAFYGTSLYN